MDDVSLICLSTVLTLLLCLGALPDFITLLQLKHHVFEVCHGGTKI